MRFLRKYQSLDSTAKGLPKGILAVVALFALGVSAAAGAWVQSQWAHDQQGYGSEQQALLQASSRDSINHLAERIGVMQAKLIAMDGLGKRVAQSAGLAYTDPELIGALEPSASDALDASDSLQADSFAWGSDVLGAKLDALAQHMSAQEDWFSMLDSVLTQRSGAEALLPNYRPIDSSDMSSAYGWRRHPVTGRHTLHEGVDFPAPRGTPIYAASGGVVTEARYAPGYGKMVEINHGNGLVTRYAHASSIIAKLGDVIEKGQMIARVGSTGQSTGAHLHFEVRMGDQALDPLVFLADRAPDERRYAQLNTADSQK